MKDKAIRYPDFGKLIKKPSVYWCLLAIGDLIALITVYQKPIAKKLSHMAPACTTVPIKKIVETLLQPRMWFLIAGSLFLIVLVAKAMAPLEFERKIRRRKLTGHIQFCLVALLLIAYYLITKAACWR